MLSEHKGLTIGLALVILVAIVAGAGKLVAERSADSDTAEKARQVEKMLDGSSPRDFLAFNAGVKDRGSVAWRISKLDGFVSVKAVAASSFIRIQPTGWWSGFTERCVVAVVTDESVVVTVPKVACIRVEPPAS